MFVPVLATRCQGATEEDLLAYVRCLWRYEEELRNFETRRLEPIVRAVCDCIPDTLTNYFPEAALLWPETILSISPLDNWTLRLEVDLAHNNNVRHARGR